MISRNWLSRLGPLPCALLLTASGSALAAQGAAAAPLTRHRIHHLLPRAAFNAYAPAPAVAPAGPESFPVTGTWRYGLLRRGCGHAYPMTEDAGCGTATGGPAGGIN